MKSLATPLPLQDWSAQDRELWRQAQEPAGFLEDGGRASEWRPDTLKGVERGYGLWLRWLVHNDQLDVTLPPQERVSKERIERFMSDYGAGRAPLTLAGTVRDIAYFFRAAGAAHEIPWLTKLAHRLINRAEPHRAKAPHIVPVRDLLELGDQLMDKGTRVAEASRTSGAQIYRDGLAIFFLAVCPLRRRNFSGLRLGATIRRDHQGWKLDIPGAQTKNKRPIQHFLPGFLGDRIDVYVDCLRPLLVARSSGSDDGWLWVSRRGVPIKDQQFSLRIPRLTERHLGRRVWPHLFRDCVATEIAVNDPRHVGISKAVLGHASLAASQQFYNQASSIQSARRLASLIANLSE